jgi:hypothetical protein
MANLQLEGLAGALEEIRSSLAAQIEEATSLVVDAEVAHTHKAQFERFSMLPSNVQHLRRSLEKQRKLLQDLRAELAALRQRR